MRSELYLCNPLAEKRRLNFFLTFFLKKFVSNKKNFTFAAASEEKCKNKSKTVFSEAV